MCHFRVRSTRQRMRRSLLSTSRAYLLTDRRICFAPSDLSPFSFGCFLSCPARPFVEIQTFIHFSHKKCIAYNAFCTVHPLRAFHGPGAPSPLRVASLRASRNLIPRPFPFLPPRERPFANNTNLLLHLFPAIHDIDATARSPCGAPRRPRSSQPALAHARAAAAATLAARHSSRATWCAEHQATEGTRAKMKMPRRGRLKDSRCAGLIYIQGGNDAEAFNSSSPIRLVSRDSITLRNLETRDSLTFSVLVSPSRECVLYSAVPMPKVQEYFL